MTERRRNGNGSGPTVETLLELVARLAQMGARAAQLEEAKALIADAQALLKAVKALDEVRDSLIPLAKKYLARADALLVDLEKYLESGC